MVTSWRRLSTGEGRQGGAAAGDQGDGEGVGEDKEAKTGEGAEVRAWPGGSLQEHVETAP